MLVHWPGDCNTYVIQVYRPGDYVTDVLLNASYKSIDLVIMSPTSYWMRHTSLSTWWLCHRRLIECVIHDNWSDCLTWKQVTSSSHVEKIGMLVRDLSWRKFVPTVSWNCTATLHLNGDAINSTCVVVWHPIPIGKFVLRLISQLFPQCENGNHVILTVWAWNVERMFSCASQHSGQFSCV